MPSEMVDQQGFSSSSYISEESHFPSERQIGFWNPETTIDHYGGRSVASSPITDKLGAVEFESMKYIKHPPHKANANLWRQAVGAERAVSRPWTYVDKDPISNANSPSYFSDDGSKINTMMGTGGLFSSSLSELFARKLRLSSNSVPYGHTVDTRYEEEETFAIGNLLPDDDDLLSGVTDGLFDDYYVVRPSVVVGDDDFDLFSSVGGMDLGDDDDHSFAIPNKQTGVGSSGSHPYGGHPSRTLFVRNINSNVEDTELQALFEHYGDIRTLYTACKHRGFVMISYYDLRAACNAMRALQNKPLRRRKLDIHFSIPKENSSDNDFNEGTLVVFNLDSSVSNDDVRQIFGVHGEIKEMGESPHKFIEFYDVRAAEAALRALNRIDIAGKRIKVELSRPKNELEQYESNLRTGFAGSLGVGENTSGNMEDVTKLGISSAIRSFVESPHGISSNSLPSIANQFGHSHCQGQLQFDFQQGGMMPILQPHSLPEYHHHHHPSNSPGTANIFSNEIILRGVSSNVHPCMWANSHNHHRQPPGMMWPNSPAHINMNGRQHGLPRAPLNPAMPINNHNHHIHHVVESAPPPPWNRQHAFVGQSPPIKASSFRPASLGSVTMHHHPLEYVPHNVFPGQMFGMMSSSFDNPNERSRSRRNDNISNQQADHKKLYELDLHRILRGDDNRTTLMIKNIPNKYTSKMLLAAIDERHRGTYDFIYLPIDFKNKCNVGYAFINMTDPSVIVPFYEAFNGKKWEKFNSEKVAYLAYARIQGKAALVAHFQNSSLMNEDKRCRPILFHTDGPNAGDQVPFPMGVNIRARPGKGRINSSSNNTNDDDEGSPVPPPNIINIGNGEASSSSSSGDSCSGSARDFDATIF